MRIFVIRRVSGNMFVVQIGGKFEITTSQLKRFRRLSQRNSPYIFLFNYAPGCILRINNLTTHLAI